jgi:hypothetical protein
MSVGGRARGPGGTSGRSEVLRCRDDAGRDDDIKIFALLEMDFLRLNANYPPDWEKGGKIALFFGPKISRPLPKPVSHLVDPVESVCPPVSSCDVGFQTLGPILRPMLKNRPSIFRETWGFRFKKLKNHTSNFSQYELRLATELKHHIGIPTTRGYKGGST